MGWLIGRASIQAGRKIRISRRGNSKRMLFIIYVIASSFSSRQFTGRHCTPKRLSRSRLILIALLLWGSVVLSRTTKGLPSSCSSVMTRSSASR